jgi:hypothetical protein
VPVLVGTLREVEGSTHHSDHVFFITLLTDLGNAEHALKRIGAYAPILVGLTSSVAYAEAALILRSICSMSVSRFLLRFS